MSTRRGLSTSILSSERKKKKSMSDIINEQLDAGDVASLDGDAWDAVGGDCPRIDDYREESSQRDDEDEDGGKIDGDRMRSKLKRSKSENSQQQRKKLRHRGPLDASLSTGEYAATPVDVEAAMDDIFGALEMNDEDDDAMGLFPSRVNDEENSAHDTDDDEDGFKSRKKSKKRASGKPETEEEYVERLEAQQAMKRKTRRVGGGGAEEDDILEQLETLRTAQMELVGTGAQESGEEDDQRAKQRQRAQDAVKHYVMVYSQLLRVRIKLQPVVARAIAFPQYYSLPDYLQVDDERAKLDREEVSHHLRDLLALFNTLSDDEKVTQKQKSTSVNFEDINACHRRMMKDVDACIDHWGAKLVQSNSVKLRTVSQPLLQQIHTVLRSKTRLRARVQKNRLHVTILGHPEHYRASQSAEGKATRALHIAEGDMDEEIYDDSEFMREVVKRGGVSKLEQQLRDIERSLNPQEQPVKHGFHRLTKGKAVNYEPRPKLVGFMLPAPYALSGQHEVLVNALFQ